MIFKDINLVAVYGSLRKGLGNHSLISHCELVSTVRMNLPYTMYSIYGAYPGLVREDKNNDITLEIYKVNDPQTKTSLDVLEGYNGQGGNNHYNKEIIDTEHGQAIIYVLASSERIGDNVTPLVENGDWAEYKTICLTNSNY